MVRVEDGALERLRALVCSQRQVVSQGPDLLRSSVLLLRVGPAGVCGRSEVSLGAWVSLQAPLERLPPVWTPSPWLSLSGPYCLLAFLRRLGHSPRRDLLPPLSSRTETLSLGSVPTRMVPWGRPSTERSQPMCPSFPGEGGWAAASAAPRVPSGWLRLQVTFRFVPWEGVARLYRTVRVGPCFGTEPSRETSPAFCLRQGDSVARGGIETAL